MGKMTPDFLFECFENKEVFNALITVWKLGQNLKLQKSLDQWLFSDKEPQGFLTKGFEEKQCSSPITVFRLW